jgi:FAD:protein FMN transferase
MIARVTPSPLGASWRALGTSVVLRVQDPAALADARAAVERELAAIDLACSRFRADSELSRLNSNAGRPTAVSELLVEALELALAGAELSDGAVDPTVGRALGRAGYDRSWELLHEPCDAPCPARLRRVRPSSAERVIGAHPLRAARVIRARAWGNWRAIALDAERGSVRVPRGISIDLGASAKAWAADRAAGAAAQAGAHSVLVGIGGDIATAGEAPRGGWRIRVTDDHSSDLRAPGQTVSIRSGGLATSSTTVRRWSREGAVKHHIIDPRTGEPARVLWRTASVAAATCAEANIATTAAVVKGPEAPAWLAGLGLPARLVDLAGNVQLVGDWPAEAPSACDARGALAV